MSAARFAGLLVGTLLVVSSASTLAAEQTDYRVALRSAAAAYNAARDRCRSLGGHEKRVCIAEAKAALARADAHAEAVYRNTPRARLDAHVAEANADYAVARTKCSAQRGAEYRACIKAAKAIQSEAITRAMRSPD